MSSGSNGPVLPKRSTASPPARSSVTSIGVLAGREIGGVRGQLVEHLREEIGRAVQRHRLVGHRQREPPPG